MLGQALIFILDTLLGLFSLALLLRFYLQLLRVPARNPLSHFLAALTDFIVRPARRVIPGLWGMDLATLLLAWLTQVFLLTAMFTLKDYALGSVMGIAFVEISLLALVEIIKLTLYIVMIAVIVQALLSWFNPHSPVAPLLDSLTRPYLQFFRRRIPPIGNVDLSPLLVLVIVQLLLLMVSGLRQEISRLF